LEETNWVAALEWADKNGAQIINNSLGYTYHRYFPEEMNGETSIVAKAAKMAAAKGILVVSAMGNDGDNDWKVLATPADADSILSVGAIDPITMFHAPYSSFGPTADFRLKPNVVAPGKVIAAGQKALKLFSGTSFSAPLIAGFAACVWQMHPEYTNMQVLEEIQKSASLYPYYDYAHGYGIPKASYFFSNTHQATTESFTVKTSRNKVIIQFNKNLPQSTNATDYLYYHIADEAGKIEEYNVIEMDKLDDYTIPIKESFKNNKIRVFYRGTFKDINFSDL
jgi:subtilisin family serine protease